MTTLIQALREKYPMYADRSDEVLIEGYRKKFHPNQDRKSLRNYGETKENKPNKMSLEILVLSLEVLELGLSKLKI